MDSSEMQKTMLKLMLSGLVKPEKRHLVDERYEAVKKVIGTDAIGALATVRILMADNDSDLAAMFADIPDEDMLELCNPDAVKWLGGLK